MGTGIVRQELGVLLVSGFYVVLGSLLLEFFIECCELCCCLSCLCCLDGIGRRVYSWLYVCFLGTCLESSLPVYLCNLLWIGSCDWSS